jgi:hypothetical protein
LLPLKLLKLLLLLLLLLLLPVVLKPVLPLVLKPVPLVPLWRGERGFTASKSDPPSLAAEVRAPPAAAAPPISHDGTACGGGCVRALLLLLRPAFRLCTPFPRLVGWVVAVVAAFTAASVSRCAQPATNSEPPPSTSPAS